MELIIRPDSPHSGRAPFAELLNKKEDLAVVVRTFTNQLAESFAVDKKRHGEGFVAKVMTEDEKKRRSAILFKWFRILRKDCGFSIQKTLSELPRAFRAELDGLDYTPPPKNRLWTPQGATL